MENKIDIAVGISARSKTWKNKKWTWPDLVKKLSEEHKTNETYGEYNSATKAERSKIKDIGGYVGGYLRHGRRKPENVVHRQLITLDLDFAHPLVWDDLTLQFENAAVLHATHSHSDKSPKFRLIMPIDREVSPDEYVAISRWIAGELGIEFFDNTGFQPYRLMFWPSNPKNIDYYFRQQEGPWVDADAILAQYTDWRDSSLWPTSSAQLDSITSLAKKQENPEEKTGVIGAFCRAFTIEEAIEQFLEEEYTHVVGDRYTYKKGSTAGGLIVYDGLYAYSHHGTDPCSGKLSNAFDLVRVHKFGHTDIDSTATAPTKMQSFKAMENFARNLEEVRLIVARETLARAQYEFAEESPDDEDDEEEEQDLEWMKRLEIDSKGKYLSTANNLNIIFSNDAVLKDKFKYNDFDAKRYVFDNVPWRKVPTPQPIKDVDYSGIRNYLESIYGIVGSLKIDDSLALEFQRQHFHPVREYLRALEWDKVQRIENLLIEYFGAEVCQYSREAIKKTLVAAVARAMSDKPVKFDLVLTLVGEQAIGKSTFVKKLGCGWSSDSFTTVHGKESFEQLQGAWIIEMAELAALRKAEVEAVKHFISKDEDTFRPAYGRVSQTYRRQCVFIGTTNTSEFLTDPTGNRRFMPVDVNADAVQKSIFDIEQSEINQIWAEAVALYNAGEPLYLSADAEKEAKKEQRQHSRTDERRGLIEEYLDVLLPEDWAEKQLYARQQFFEDELTPVGTELRDYVCVAEIWCECLGKDRAGMTRYNTRDINDILRNLDGWDFVKSTRNFPLYGKQKYYVRNIL